MQEVLEHNFVKTIFLLHAGLDMDNMILTFLFSQYGIDCFHCRAIKMIFLKEHFLVHITTVTTSLHELKGQSEVMCGGLLFFSLYEFHIDSAA